MNTRLFMIVCLLGLSAATDAGQDGRAKLIERFDTNGDGRLDSAERAELRKFIGDLRGPRHKPLPQTLSPGQADLYKFTDGPHEIDEIKTANLVDPDRDKTIPLRLTFPKAGGPYPVVIFCHGALGSKDGGDPLAHFWASHGYVVIRPTFGDSISLMSDEDKAKVKSLTSLVNSWQVKREWDQRPRDVSHVIDSLGDLAEQVEALRGRLDVKRIAVSGHSYGAHTTMLIAGLSLQDPRGKESVSFRDGRVSAHVMISPQGPTEVITAESYKALAGPIMMITGDHDGTPIKGREDKAGAWRAEAYEHCPPGDKYLLWVTDAHHGFGGINGRAQWSGAGPRAPDQVNIIKTTALAMFDAYVKGDAAAKAFLAGDRLDRAANGLATLKRK